MFFFHIYLFIYWSTLRRYLIMRWVRPSFREESGRCSIVAGLFSHFFFLSSFSLLLPFLLLLFLLLPHWLHTHTHTLEKSVSISFRFHSFYSFCRCRLLLLLLLLLLLPLLNTLDRSGWFCWRPSGVASYQRLRNDWSIVFIWCDFKEEMFLMGARGATNTPIASISSVRAPGRSWWISDGSSPVFNVVWLVSIAGDAWRSASENRRQIPMDGDRFSRFSSIFSICSSVFRECWIWTLLGGARGRCWRGHRSCYRIPCDGFDAVSACPRVRVSRLP